MSTATIAASRKTAGILWQIILPVALLLAYQLYAMSANNLYIPTIPEIISSFVETWGGEGITDHVVPSLTNLARGYFLGLAAGIAFGVLLGRLALVRKAVNPIVSFMLTIPPVALLPLLLMVLGVGPQLQVATIFIAVFFYVLVSTADGVSDVEPTLIDVARIYRVRNWRNFFLILIPAALPSILSAARVTLSLGILVMVVSEMVGSSRGIGAVTLLSQQQFQYDQMWAGMVLLALLGILLNAIFLLFERLFLASLHLAPNNTKTGAKT